MKAKCYACVNGPDVHNLVPESHVVVGTRGHIMDMIVKKSLQTKFIKIFALDEADEILFRCVSNQIQNMFKFFEDNIQVILLSVTMSEVVLYISTHFMRNPVHTTIIAQKEELTLLEGMKNLKKYIYLNNKLIILYLGIKQFYINVTKEGWKFDTLCDLYDALSTTQTLIFCNTRRKVEWLTENMGLKSFNVSSMHGEMKQCEREIIIRQFRTGSIQVLITTDLSAVDIDIQQISLVINYDMPYTHQNYMYRIRHSGHKGITINFITKYDKKTMKNIESFYNTCMHELPENVADLL